MSENSNLNLYSKEYKIFILVLWTVTLSTNVRKYLSVNGRHPQGTEP